MDSDKLSIWEKTYDRFIFMWTNKRKKTIAVIIFIIICLVGGGYLASLGANLVPRWGTPNKVSSIPSTEKCPENFDTLFKNNNISKGGIWISIDVCLKLRLNSIVFV
jgi:hypothetical protein